MFYDAIKMIFLLQTTSAWELNRFVSFCCITTWENQTHSKDVFTKLIAFDYHNCFSMYYCKVHLSKCGWYDEMYRNTKLNYRIFSKSINDQKLKEFIESLSNQLFTSTTVSNAFAKWIDSEK